MTRVIPWALGLGLAAPVLAVERTERPAPFAFSVSADVLEDSGTGCPDGSFDYQVSSDNQWMRFRYFAYRVAAGNGLATDAKDCRLRLDLNVPRGWSVGIESVDVKAYAALTDQYASGTSDVSYMIDWNRGPVDLVRRAFAGPYDGEFSLPGRAPRDRIQYTVCDDFARKTLDLASRFTVSASGFSTAEVRESVQQGAVVQDYKLVWVRCNTPPPPPPPPRDWIGTCRAVHETIWGQDLREFWGRGYGRTQQDALGQARGDGLNQCERVRGGDSLSRCVIDNGQCTATQG